MDLENDVFIFIYPDVFCGAAVAGGYWAVRGPELGRRGGGEETERIRLFL